MEDFYRVFKRYRKVSVREYQTKNIGCGAQMQSGEESLQILEYLFLHFQKTISNERNGDRDEKEGISD